MSCVNGVGVFVAHGSSGVESDTTARRILVGFVKAEKQKRVPTPEEMVF